MIYTVHDCITEFHFCTTYIKNKLWRNWSLLPRVTPFMYFPQLLAFVKTLSPVYLIRFHVKLISQIQEV